MRTYEVELEGTYPLLMHWDNIEWADAMTKWKDTAQNKKYSRAGDDRTPAFRWIGAVYHDGEHVVAPSDNVSRCLLDGGAMVPVPGGRGGKTFKAQTQSGMRIQDPFCELKCNGKVIEWR